MEILLGLVLLASLAGSGARASASEAQRPRPVCVSVQAYGLPEETDLRSAFLRGFQRPFLLDSLLVERRASLYRWIGEGKVANGIRLSTEPCPQARPDPMGRTWVPVMAPSEGFTGKPEVGLAVRLGGWSTIGGIYVYPKGRAPTHPDSFPLDRNLLTVWTAVSSPESARTPPDSSWESTRVNWAERPADDRRAQEIRGWLVGMAALQAVSRKLALLPDTLDLVFESRGRNR